MKIVRELVLNSKNYLTNKRKEGINMTNFTDLQEKRRSIYALGKMWNFLIKNW